MTRATPRPQFLLHGKKSSSTRVEADEFAVLLLDQTLEQAVQMAEKIRSDIEVGSIDIDGESVSFTVSIGVAAILEHSPDIEEVTSAARSAMQHAKQRGRNQVVQYEEEQSNRAQRHHCPDAGDGPLERADGIDRHRGVAVRKGPRRRTAIDLGGL